jgi:hypothetical protein
MAGKINYVGGEIYKSDPDNIPIQQGIKIIFEEIRPMYTDTRKAEDFSHTSKCQKT